MDKELHDKAWSLLEERGLSLGDRMMVRSHFASSYKEEYPFVVTVHTKGYEAHYKSEIPELDSYGFSTEQEVILANAIFENTKENFNPNEFIAMFKFTLRILGVESVWSK